MFGKIFRSAGALSALATFTACQAGPKAKFDAIPNDDADANANYDDAFVRNVIPTLLGRQPLSSREVYGLREIVKAWGRGKLVDTIMNRPEFSAYWSSVLLEDLKPELLGGGNPYELLNAGCLSNEYLTSNSARISAAKWVGGSADPDSLFQNGGVSTVFSMRDMAKGAILDDRLQPIYAGWIAMLTATKGIDGNQIGYYIEGAILNRDRVCLGCHNPSSSSTYRAVSQPGDPNRHYPTIWSDGRPIQLEKSTMGVGFANQAYIGDLGGFFTKDAPAHYVNGALQSPPGPTYGTPNGAWGIYCSESLAPNSLNTSTVAYAGQTGTGKGTRALISAFKTGVTKLGQRTPVLDANAMTDPDAAFAYLIAMNVVDNVYEEVTGSRLTLQHGFSRTEDQRFIHTTLTAAFLGDNISTPNVYETSDRWSLKGLLKAIVLNNKLYNRKAPADSPDPNKYKLPMVANHWALYGGSPNAATGVDSNGQGDLVNRRSAVALFLATSKANGENTNFGSFVGAPSATYPALFDAGELGAHVSGGQPANRAIGLNTLLAWADRPSPSTGTWAVKLDQALNATWVNGVSNKYKYQDLAVAVKDRVFSQPSLTQSESDLVKQMFGIANMNDYVSQSWYQGVGRTRVLEYMAILEESPQFMLSGLPPLENLPPVYPDPTRLDVIPSGEPTTAMGWVQAYGFSEPILGCGSGSGAGSGSGSCAASSVTVNGKTCYCNSTCLANNNCCFDKFDVCPTQ
ncbi:MAG: hypothetical protein IPK82_15735 [Polyangiaceae bacterium]|nr:hypothetical protein [Polyangiaceae bacterium]